MSSVWERYGAVILAVALVGVPIGIVTTVWLARRRVTGGRPRGWAWRASIAEVGLVLGTLPWVWMIMEPTSGSGGLQLVPFRDLGAVLTGEDSVVQVIGNLLVFAAAGFFLPIRFRLARPVFVPAVVALVAGGGSLILEVVQLALPLGRVASVDDILLNAAGAVIAALASIRFWRSRADTPAQTLKRNSTTSPSCMT
jgi:glycopeptide antibiotics resistance protein